MDIPALQRPGPALAPASVDVETAQQNREIVAAIKAINAAELTGWNSELTFTLDPGTQRPVIRVVDKTTKDVIRQIPPEYVLRLAEEIDKRDQ